MACSHGRALTYNKQGHNVVLMKQPGQRVAGRRSYEKWSVRSYSRKQGEWTGLQRFETEVYDQVVVVNDPRGWTWEVVLKPDHTAIQWLSISGRIDQNALRSVPLKYLLEVAADYLRKLDTEYEAGLTLLEAREFAATEPGEFEISGDPPTAEQFAAKWHSTPESTFEDGKRVTRRWALKKHYNVSVFAIDKWTRKARDAGLLPDANPRTDKVRDQR